DVLLEQLRQDALDQAHEVGRVARARIARALLLHDAERDLGQVVERQVVERPLAQEAHRTEDRIAPEALTVGDEDSLLGSHGRRGGGRILRPQRACATLCGWPSERDPWRAGATRSMEPEKRARGARAPKDPARPGTMPRAWFP